MKSNKCKNYIKEAGCVAHYGHSCDDKCKGHKGSCYMYEPEIGKELKSKASNFNNKDVS